LSHAAAHVEIVVAGLLLAVAALVTAARVLGVPYPVFLVIGGLGLGLMPGIPELALDPDLVLLIFLPPLLYGAAFFTSLRELRANVGSISLLAVGLVLATCMAVAVVAHAVVDGLSWPAAFALGAIVSPTDPVAATAVASRLGLPRRVVAVVEGEALVNDATALVAYRVAVAAVVTGSFSALDAGWTFLYGAIGGVVVGIVAGWLVTQVRLRLDDPPVEITISILTAYVAYLPAEELGFSGVMAAVTVGLYMGIQTPRVTTAMVRMESKPVWEILTFLLNSFLFVLIGLQLPTVLDELKVTDVPIERALWWGAVISVVVIATRLVWTFVFTWLPHRLSRRARGEPMPANEVALIGWMGMRGAVSLAAALALPLQTDAGEPFGARAEILFIVFAVILFTLVLQGLTLTRVVRLLGVQLDEDAAVEEDRARVRAAEAALERLDSLAGEDWTYDQSVERARNMLDYRRARFKSRFRPDDDGRYETQTGAWVRLQKDLIDAQRSAIEQMRRNGEISDDVMRRVERDLDLEESRLSS
jgi:CPA1 family monovalent cation:H+ antiporter